MTINEGIKNLEYGTKQLEMEIESGLWIKGSESELCCKEGIALNKQHIEWLKELKEAKRLLKVAVEDIRHCMHSYDPSEVCSLLDKDGECPATDDDDCKEKYKWRYEAEALKLIGDNNR